MSYHMKCVQTKYLLNKLTLNHTIISNRFEISFPFSIFVLIYACMLIPSTPSRLVCNPFAGAYPKMGAVIFGRLQIVVVGIQLWSLYRRILQLTVVFASLCLVAN